MKPEANNEKEEGDEGFPTVAGDVIGDTAYSERFVLKILLKLANLDTLKEEINEKSFEDDLCILWDMTAERDVVLFLQKHDVLKLFNFAMPMVQSPRIIEIIIGIIGNMCCQKEVVTNLMKMNNFVALLLSYINTDDSLVLVQLLRLVSACLFLAENYVTEWMDLFISTDYSTALYFIFKNSSNKDLLVTAFENFNTICSYCNIEKCRIKYFEHFVTEDALESLVTAFIELSVKQNKLFVKDELERILVVNFQIILNLVGFDKSLEIYSGSFKDLLNMINVTLTYYKEKLVKHKEIDTDLIDIIESTNTIINVLKINEVEPDKYLEPCFCIWINIRLISKTEQKDSFDDDKKDLNDFSNKIQPGLGTLICNYISKCSDKDLLRVLDLIESNYEDIVNAVQDEELKISVSSRTEKYRTRLKENVDS